MKKISIILLSITLIASCKKQHPKDYVTISGKISGIKDTISILNREGFVKKIVVSADESFKDTLKLAKKGEYALLETKTQKFITMLYLDNGYELNITADATSLPKSLKFMGSGTVSNNFIMSQMMLMEKIGSSDDLFVLDKSAFDSKIKSLKTSVEDSYKPYKDADSTLVADTKLRNKMMFESIKKGYATQHPLALKRAEAMKKLAKGNVSPKFVNYRNAKGGKTSLSNLRGKYVYIDLWATWCGPCKAEIPSLKRLEEVYHDKNIAFVSISIDNERTSGTWDKAQKTWEKMVADKSLGGIQLFAGKDVKFVKDYQVNTIPRFILIDPKGNIVNADAPRPSEPKLKDVFKELGI